MEKLILSGTFSDVLGGRTAFCFAAGLGCGIIDTDYGTWLEDDVNRCNYDKSIAAHDG
jgi:hypothetical protein